LAIDRFYSSDADRTRFAFGSASTDILSTSTMIATSATNTLRAISSNKIYLENGMGEKLKLGGERVPILRQHYPKVH